MGLTEINIECTHKIEKPKHSKKKPRTIIIKFVRYNCRKSIFSYKEKLKNTGISITESLNAKRMEMLNNAKKTVRFQKCLYFDGRISLFSQGFYKTSDLQKLIISAMV